MADHDWTGGQLLAIAAGAVGVGYLVHRAYRALHPELGPAPAPGIQPLPLPRPAPEPPPAPPRPPRPSGHRYPAQVEQWADELERQAPDIPRRFLLNYLDKESGGNPCGMGFHGQKFPDGLYKFEAGIGQNYFAAKTRRALDQKTSHGVTLAELRAPCQGNHQIRELTPAERQKNVQAFLGDVRDFIITARAQIARAGLDWPETGDDFWMLVKLQHGLPCVPKSFLVAAADAGHAGSFDAFAAWVNALPRERYDELTGSAHCRPAMDRFFGAGTRRALENARSVGHGVTS